jgi:catechol 2,3-dioxygenase-like lactoylglutathione lyase family enzyme
MKPPKLLRILETALYVEDMAAAKKFYSEILELPLLAEEAGRMLVYKVGDDMLLICCAPETLKRTSVPPHGTSGPGHMAFEVGENEFDAWKRHLVSKNIKIEKEVTWKSSARSMYFFDPSDNVLEIATPGIWKKIG